MDDVYARAKKIKVGQTLHILEHDFHVAGIVEHGKGARLFVLMSTLQEMAGAHDKASIFFIKCDRSDHTAAAADEVHSLLPGYEIRPLKDFMSQMTSSNVPFLGTFINVMIGIAVGVGFLVTFLSMYTTIIERTREIGVLKSLGASKTYIVEIILSETTLLCLAGMVAGVGLSLRHEGNRQQHLAFVADPYHRALDYIRRLDRHRGRTSGRILSRLARQPQRPGRGSRLRVSCTEPAWARV